MCPNSMGLSEAIHILCFARDKISDSQFWQLMDPDNDDEKIPCVRLSSLSVSEVENVLGLRSAYHNRGLGSFPDVPLPELLISGLSMIDSFLITGASTKATIRWRMCKFIRLAFDEAMNSSSEQGGRLEIHLERRWSFGPIRYNDQVVKLSGYPSYVLWYGDEDDMALNVMVAQDERFDESDKGIAEVLGYLAFVYHHRKNAKKENCPLYGIATDSTTFHFVRLDNDSTYVTTTLDSRVDLEKTFGLLVHVLKQASAVSSIQPTASFTQPDQGEGSTEPLVPTESCLRRKVDKRMQYERLKFEDSEELEDSFPEYETSEDEYSEDG